MKKRILSLLCSLALLVTMMPVSAFAADASWAQSAVSALNEIYGSGVFSADDGLMSNADVKSVLSKTGWETEVLLDDNEFTRSDACEVLADVFMLPLGNQSAIQYLYDKNIVSGTANGDLNEDSSVSFAEFSVLSYRVLNTVGGGMGSAISGLKPGTDEYYGWLYLAVRKCVPFSAERGNEKIGQAESFTTYGGSQLKYGYTDVYEVVSDTVSRKAIWNAWEDALQDPQIGGDTGFSATSYDENDTLLQAAGKIVKQFANYKYDGDKYDGDLVIFHDVTAGDWFYDGIIYLADRQIVIGYGDGQFGPDDIAPRFQFAVLLSVMDGTVSGTDTSPGRIPTAIDHVKEMGYMTAEVPDDDTWNPFTDPIWSAATTREEAAVGILKMIESKYGINTKSENISILDRFVDVDKIADPDSKPYLAYAVSVGLLSGTSSNTLEPDAEVSRAQTGVLLYRTLLGLDKSKMKDYADNVSDALGNSAAGAVFSLPVQRAETTASSKILTLREDWRLTSDLDLAVPAGTTLEINGAGHHIYEMGGRLLNSGAGTVTFINNTALYPNGSATEGVAVNGIWDSEESNALMTIRQTGSSGGGSSSGGSGNKTETITNPDGSTTTTVTRPDGSTTETTKNPDGSTEIVDTKKDGTVTTTTTDKDGNKIIVTENTDGTSETIITNTNGTTSTTVQDANGKTETTVKLSASIIADAADKGETVVLPMPEVTATSDSASASIVTVDLSGSQSAKVEIPVAGVTSGTVAVIVGEDGEKTIVMNSIPTENGVVMTLADGDTVKVMDNSKDFADVPDSYWGADAVDFATSRELFNGTSETAFTPDGNMTRAMIVTVLARYEGVDTSTGDTWYDAGRNWAMEAGISDGTDMDGTLTREQLATMLYRYAQSKGQGFAGTWAFQLDYSDADAVSDYAYEAMCWTTMHGIINGMGDGSLAPQGQATRAQVATMLMRFITTIA